MQGSEPQVAYELEGCEVLSWAVLARAVRDIRRGTRWERENAIRFVQGDEAQRWCEGLGVEVTLLRAELEPGGALCAKVSPYGEAPI